MTDWWNGMPWRMIQTNLREIDMLDIDAERFVADLQSFKATAVLFNTAGIIASYPTALPYHFQSPYLQGSSLEEIIDVCHAAGIRFLARTDFSKVRRPIYEEHPEWAYCSPAGEIVDYNGDVHVCLNSAYQQDYALRIIEEAITRLDLDGIFFNMSGYQTTDYSGRYYGICHCQNCVRRFAAFAGQQLPGAEDMRDPVYRRYVLFRRHTVAEHQDRVGELIRSLRPDMCVANHLAARRGVIRQESNTGLGRPLPHWQYSASENTKWAVSSYPEMVSSNTTVDFIDYPYRHVAVSPEQQRLRLAQNLANGGGLDYYLIGRIDNHADRSGFAPVREMFHYHAAHEQEYQRLRSCANVALLHGPDANGAEFRGWFRFLVENHFLFDILMLDRALDLPLDRYRAIIVPDYQPLDDEAARRLDAFVEAGGTLIATSRAGMRDAQLEAREAPALRCLGIERVALVRDADAMRSAYLKIEGRSRFPHLPDTELLYLDGSYVYAHYARDVERYLKLVPPHSFGPPERCYYTQVTEHPGLVVNAYGRGRALYLPWQPGAQFLRQGYTNTFAFATDFMQEFAGLTPVGGNLPPMVEVTLFEQARGGAASNHAYLLHLVNASGQFGASFYPHVPMYDREVVLNSLGTPSAVTSLVTGEELAFRTEGDALVVSVPRLELFEALKIAY